MIDSISDVISIEDAKQLAELLAIRQQQKNKKKHIKQILKQIKNTKKIQ